MKQREKSFSSGKAMMRQLRTFFLLSLFLKLAFDPATGGAGVIDDLKPGQWYEVLNSKLRAVVPSPSPPGIVGPPAVVSAWSGAAYDSRRERLVVWGGGHGDYGGNELYAFDLNTLTWSRIWGPSSLNVIPPVGSLCSEVYADGNPASRHTYDGLEYIPSIDRFFAQGGSLYCGTGGFGNGTWFFDFDQLKWERKANSNLHPNAVPFSAYDPVTGLIYMHRYNLFGEYNPITNTWKQRGGYGPGISPNAVAVLDPVRKKFILVGGGSVRWYDLTQTASLSLTTIATTGDTAPVSASYPGAEYDPVSDRIVAWIGGADVYSLNLNTLVWTKIPPASTNTVIPTNPTSTGTHGRWRYIPSKNAFIVVNSIDQNVYIYKLSAASPSPSPSFNFSLSNGGSKSVVQAQTVSNLITTSLTSGTSQSTSFSTTGLPSGATYTYTPTSCTPTCSATLKITTSNTTPTGNYTVTATASGGGITKTTSFTLTVTPATSLSPPPAGWVNIPLQTWVARPIPSGFPRSAKHIAVSYNPDDGLVYLLGGDHAGSFPSPTGAPQSGRNEMYTYNVANDIWKLIQPYCRTDATPQPSGPDEVGWAYDTKRKIFWMVPGFQWAPSAYCPNSMLVRGGPMTYNPASGTWTVPTITTSPRGNAGNFTQYDPVTDTLIRFVNAGPEVNVYTIATDTWIRKGFGLPNENFSDVGTTIDIVGRHVYFLTAGKLYQYHIDTKTLVNLGPAPGPTLAENKPLWDPINKVLLWPVFNDADTASGAAQEQVHLHVYHPDTSTWEVDLPIPQPQGKLVKGRHAIFDPARNVLMVFGNVWNSPTAPDIFLFRYGNGNGTTPPPTPPPPPSPSVPLAPANLKVQ